MKFNFPYSRLSQLITASLLLILNFIFSISATAQPTTLVYSENFNSPSHGWTIGGYSPSWSYGIPTLGNISSNGTACFSTGDAGMANVEPFTSCIPFSGPTLNGNYYNCCERSFVQSPIIDLTGINSPMISVDINIHCEQTFDGSKMQLSINGGTSWIDIGSMSSSTYQTFPSSLNCREQNWYNKSNINYLSNTNGGCGAVSYAFGGSNSGWSGGCSQDGSGACTGPDNHGSNGWITATHCIQQAANKSSVMVRVVFGGGSQVYSDGIAFDNVKIFDVFPLTDFSTSTNQSCDPELTFNNLTDCAKTYEWDFGHPNSPGNTSNIADPIHIFPSAGNYNVKLTATDFCGGVVSINKNVIVNSGTGPVIGNVSSTSSALCNQPLDSLIISLVAPGSMPYSVSWMYQGGNFTENGLVQNPIIISGLSPGNYYSIVVTDANNCESNYSSTVNIPFNSDGITVDAGNDVVISIGDSVELNAVSNLPATYQWSPSNSISDPSIQNPVVYPENSTQYYVQATSNNGCTSVDEIIITVKDENPCTSYFIPNSFTPNKDGKNEIFKVIPEPLMQIADYSMEIFNRWGQTIFTSDAITKGWTGDDLPAGVYAYIVKFTCRNRKHSYKNGTITLIR